MAKLGTALFLGLCLVACSGDRIPGGTLRVELFEADGLEAGVVSGQLVRVRYSGLATRHGIQMVLEGPGHAALETRELYFAGREQERAVDLDLAVRVEFQTRKVHDGTHS